MKSHNVKGIAAYAIGGLLLAMGFYAWLLVMSFAIWRP